MKRPAMDCEQISENQACNKQNKTLKNRTHTHMRKRHFTKECRQTETHGK